VKRHQKTLQGEKACTIRRVFHPARAYHKCSCCTRYKAHTPPKQKSARIPAVRCRHKENHARFCQEQHSCMSALAVVSDCPLSICLAAKVRSAPHERPQIAEYAEHSSTYRWECATKMNSMPRFLTRPAGTVDIAVLKLRGIV
jgi:hypothetical protein